MNANSTGDEGYLYMEVGGPQSELEGGTGSAEE